MQIEKSLFGKTSSGEDVHLYRIRNSKGGYAGVIDYGAVLTELVVPDAEGNLKDVVLGYDSFEPYEDNIPSFGATIGRVANRIENGAFNIGGTDYELTLNEKGRNSLHSGPNGYQKRMWSASADEDAGSVTFSLVSPDGDQGFPGEFRVEVTYTFDEEMGLEITYSGVSDADTVVNMTNHSYFNLDGQDSGSILEHTLMIEADAYTPSDEHQIPIGTVEDVEGTPFDFREMKPIGRDIFAEDEQLAMADGFDHNFALRGSGMRHAATALASRSGILMEVYTDQPGIQFYAGNHLKGPAGKGGVEYRPRDGFALETQHFPNSVNVLAFESPKIDAGERYYTKTRYAFSVRS